MEVSGISKTSETSAIADVTLGFEPDDGYFMYEFHEAFFDRYTLGGGFGGTVRNRLLGQQRLRIVLRKFDDGWRVDQVFK